MSRPATTRCRAVTADAATALAPLADAGAPVLHGPETRVQFLALILLRLSVDIALLPALLLILLASYATRRRRTRGPWYLSAASQDSIDALSPRMQRAARRLLAVIGWALAGIRNRGMHPHARAERETASALRPLCGARAPPHPA